jgi:hypothetical protein
MKIYYNPSYRPPEIAGEGADRQMIRLPDERSGEDFRMLGIEIPFSERRMVARGLRLSAGLDYLAKNKLHDIKMHDVSLLTAESLSVSQALAMRLEARERAAEMVAIELDTPGTSDEVYRLDSV